MSSQRFSLLLCFATTVLAMSARIAGGLHHRRHVTHDTSLFPRYAFWAPSIMRQILNRSRRSIDILPRDDCEPADPQNTVTDRLNTLLNSSGPGYTLPLCPGQTYYITAPLAFAAHNQEISTVGYPEGDTRATLVVSGAVTGGTGQTTAVSGQCADCDDIKLRHIQVRITALLVLGDD